MAIVKNDRPRRVNIDGKSCTELGISDVDQYPGTIVYFDGGKWKVAATKRPGSFVVQCGDNVGASILDPIPAGDSVTGDRFEEGRMYAALVAAGTVLKANETLLKQNATGQLEVATGPFDDVVAVAFEDFTVPAAPAFSHAKIRVV